MILKVLGQDKVRNKMRLLLAQRSGHDCFIDVDGYTRAARPIKQGEIITLPEQKANT